MIERGCPFMIHDPENHNLTMHNSYINYVFLCMPLTDFREGKQLISHWNLYRIIRIGLDSFFESKRLRKLHTISFHQYEPSCNCLDNCFKNTFSSIVSEVVTGDCSVKHSKVYSKNGKGGSRTAATSKMEHFVIIVNGWKPLIIITKSSIFDVAAVLDPHLIDVDSPYKNPKIPQNS